MNRNYHYNQVQSLLAKSAENMLLAINKHKQIIMLWHIYIWRKKRHTTKEKSNAKTRQHTHTRTHTHTHTHTRARAHTHMYTHERAHLRTHIHAHNHTNAGTKRTENK